MDRLYRRNVISQCLWFKYAYITRKTGGPLDSIGLRLFGWIVADILVGVVFFHLSALIFQLNWVELLVDGVTFYMMSFFHWTNALLLWVTDVPVGLKLNNPLTEFVSSRSLTLLQVWEQFYNVFVYPNLSHIISLILTAKYFSTSLTLALIHDFLKFLNLHLMSFYIFSLKILSLQISSLISFWRLFRGCKYNPLRNRVDSCHYNPNQLVLGTLLFTILLFLLPTSLLFHVIFFAIRIVQFSIQLAIRAVIVIINKLTMSIIRWVVSLYMEQDISGLHYVISEEADNVGCVRVDCIWNGKKWNLNDISSIISQKKYIKNVNDNNILNQHLLMKWFDVSCF
jgi:phosphatidylinositol glycan class Q protein